MILRRTANVVEVIGLVAVVVFVVLLFTNQAASPAVMPVAPTGATLSPDQARTIYLSTCASCHGDDGEGVYGPAIAGDHSVQRFGSIDDEVAVVEMGRGQMKSFASSLSPEQIRGVLTYVRQLPTRG
jgi:mono/diheme cytochrome c family protein